MYVEYLVGRMTFLNQTQTLGQVAKVTVTHRGYASLLIIHIHSIEWIIASCQVQILAFGEQSCAYCLLWQYKRIIFLISSWTPPSPGSFILSHGLSLSIYWFLYFHTHTYLYVFIFIFEYITYCHLQTRRTLIPFGILVFTPQSCFVNAPKLSELHPPLLPHRGCDKQWRRQKVEWYFTDMFFTGCLYSIVGCFRSMLGN